VTAGVSCGAWGRPARGRTPYSFSRSPRKTGFRIGSKATWTFDDQLKLTSVPEGGTGNGSDWTIKIDPEKTPKEIDIDTLKGIYEFDGDDIRVAFSVGAGRPASFDSKEGVHYIVLRCTDPKKDK